MRILRFAVVVAVSSVLVGLVGCQRVNQQKTVTLGPGDTIAAFIVDPPARDQTVTLTAKTNGELVDVYIVLDKDREAAMKGLESAQAPKNALAGKPKVEKETTLTATVPAKNGYAVLLGNAPKDVTVFLKLSAK